MIDPYKMNMAIQYPCIKNMGKNTKQLLTFLANVGDEISSTL